MRAALFLLMSGAAFAQTWIASVEPVVPRNRMICGESLKITVIVRDNTGALRTGDRLQYVPTTAGVVTIAENGTVRAAGLGTTEIWVYAGAARGHLLLQVAPQKIEITPANAVIAPGEALVYTAKVLDVAGREIAQPPIRWDVTTGQGFVTNAAAFSAEGRLTAIAEGRLLVHAIVDYQQNFPGVQADFRATVPVTVRARSAFRLEKVPGLAETRSSFRLRPRRPQLVGNDAGRCCSTLLWTELRTDS